MNQRIIKQQNPHGDASIDNRKTPMVMMNQWEEKKKNPMVMNQSTTHPKQKQKNNHPW